MANVRLEPPESFDFAKPDNWPRWKKRFQQFRTASGLQTQDEQQQVSMLLYCLGETSDDVLTSTKISADDQIKFDSVMSKFDEFFQVRRNTIFERAKFNRRSQMAGESAEQYITALYNLVETCEYGTMTEEMMRDRLVVGMRDIALSERLQMDPKLTLEVTKKALRQKEAVKEQSQQLQQELKPKELDAVSTDGAHSRAATASTDVRMRHHPKRPSPVNKTEKPQCTRCGRARHPIGTRCPARSAICHKCNRKGHYEAQCFSKTVAATNELDVDQAFLGALEDEQNPCWRVSIRVGDKWTSFKLDTGAQVTAITQQTYDALGRPQLRKPSKILYGPARQTLGVIGQFSVTLSHGHKSSKQKVFVVRNLRNNLLGLPAITALHLACRIDETLARDPYELRRRYPNVFKGLGSLGDQYTIRLKDSATPYSLYTPRNVALPLRGKVQEELDRMEKLGVISKSKEPTPWCAGMVVVPEKTGEVRICVDLKPLN